MKTINLKCCVCDEYFEKVLKEYNRQKKKGREDFYCSNICVNIKNKGNTYGKGNKGKKLSPEHIEKLKEAKRDEFFWI